MKLLALFIFASLIILTIPLSVAGKIIWCGSSKSQDFCVICYNIGGRVKPGEARCWCDSKNTYVNPWFGICPPIDYPVIWCGSSTSQDFCVNCYNNGGRVRPGEASCWCDSKNTYIDAWLDDCPAITTTTTTIPETTTTIPSAEYFTIMVSGTNETFCIYTTNSQTIHDAIDNFYGLNSKHPHGPLLAGNGGFNQPWSWHLDPTEVRMVEFSSEVCDGRPSDVENNLDYWLNTVGYYCPWSGQVTDIGCEGVSTTTTTSTRPNSCTDTDEGDKPKEWGTVSGIYNGVPYSYTDECLGSLEQKEYYCVGTSWTSKTYNCWEYFGFKYYCERGRCRQLKGGGGGGLKKTLTDAAMIAVAIAGTALLVILGLFKYFVKKK